MKQRNRRSNAMILAVMGLLASVAASPAAAHETGGLRPLTTAKELMGLKLLAGRCTLGPELTETANQMAGSSWARLPAVMSPKAIESARREVHAGVEKSLRTDRLHACQAAQQSITDYSSSS